MFDGIKWETFPLVDTHGGGKAAPMEPVLKEDGSETLFVSIASYRDGVRCANTIKSLFDNAHDPDKITVGLVEHAHEDDVKCLEHYCSLHGIKIGKHTRKFDPTENRKRCPYYSRIRYLAVFAYGAKGPVVSRALHRKILGNEDFCLQIDAHTGFKSDWDVTLKEEWTNCRNEYGIVSTVPPPLSDYDEGQSEVARRCHLQIAENGIPEYKKDEGKVSDLPRPVLSPSWSASFSFSKCHLSTATPYDAFSPQTWSAEQFPYLVRFWTRGYDVYTPTRNVLFHNFTIQDGVAPKGWIPNNRERKESLKRIKSILGMEGDEKIWGNFGVYGLGRRRTLEQFEHFAAVNLKNVGAQASVKSEMGCGEREWVSYDLGISALESRYDAVSEMEKDPDPEFPLRTIGSGLPGTEFLSQGRKEEGLEVVATTGTNITAGRVLVLGLLWLGGIIVWMVAYSNMSSKGVPKKKRKKHSKNV